MNIAAATDRQIAIASLLAICGKEAAERWLDKAAALDTPDIQSAALPRDHRPVQIVDAVINDLAGRSGIGDEIDGIERETYDEMRTELVALVAGILAR